MLDSTMQPDLTEVIRKLNARVESLEMAQRVIRGYSYAFIYPTSNALVEPAGLTPQGAAASYTDVASYTEVIAGDFVATGASLQGYLYYWLPPAHTMSVKVTVAEYGGTEQTIHEVTGITATGPGDFWNATIPDTALAPLSNDVRGGLFRLRCYCKMDAGAQRVGIAVAGTPFTSPD